MGYRSLTPLSFSLNGLLARLSLLFMPLVFSYTIVFKCNLFANRNAVLKRVPNALGLAENTQVNTNLGMIGLNPELE